MHLSYWTRTILRRSANTVGFVSAFFFVVTLVDGRSTGAWVWAIPLSLSGALALWVDWVDSRGE